MKILMIFNRQPYDHTDVSWNGLRLAGKLNEKDQALRIFLVNDAVDLARDATVPPEGVEDQVAMLKALIAKGVEVKACGTCMTRCGVHKNKPYFEGAVKSTMTELADWVIDSDKVISI